MARDAQGHDLTGATADAVRPFDQAVRAFGLVYGDTLGLYDKAIAAAPQFVMAHLGKAWPLSLANDPKLIDAARSLVAAAGQFAKNEREQAHLEALRCSVKGLRGQAVTVLEKHLLHYPYDLVAHMAALQMDGHLGRFNRGRDRSARALPRWSTDQDGYGIMRGFYAFGLEESGEYAKAEDIAREAAELEPTGYWPHHCVSHVMEMTGRPGEGLHWMNEREALWSAPQATNRVHIWWHKALFHVERGEYDAALALYDGPISETVRPAAMSLCNPSALLWRLQVIGVDVGDRWQHDAAAWTGRADGTLAPFPDIHATMADLGAGNWSSYARRLDSMRATASERTELGALYRDIGVPIAEGLAAFAHGRYGDALDRLFPVRAELWRMGGSMAQRDVVDWTITEAAVRAGDRDAATALADERLALRPDSIPNREFRVRAEALG